MHFSSKSVSLHDVRSPNGVSGIAAVMTPEFCGVFSEVSMRYLEEGACRKSRKMWEISRKTRGEVSGYDCEKATFTLSFYLTA